MDCYTVMCMVSMYIIGHVTSLQHVVAEGFLNPFNHAGCAQTYCLKQVFFLIMEGLNKGQWLLCYVSTADY